MATKTCCYEKTNHLRAYVLHIGRTRYVRRTANTGDRQKSPARTTSGRTEAKARRTQRRAPAKKKRAKTPQPLVSVPPTNPAPEIIHEEIETPREPAIISKQKETESQPAPIKNQTHSTSPKIIQSSKQAVSPIVLAPEAPYPDTKSEKGNPILWLLLIIGLFVFLILRWLFSRRCGNCGRFWAMRVIDEAYLGRVKTERVKNGTQSYLVHYNRIQVTRQCKYCGHQDCFNKTVKGDAE